MGREGSPSGYLPQSASQRTPEAGIRRFDTGVFGADVSRVAPRTTTLAGRVRPASPEEVAKVRAGFPHEPIDGPSEERGMGFADTGPEGLGIPSLKHKGSGKSRKEHPEKRDRGYRSPQYYSGRK